MASPHWVEQFLRNKAVIYKESMERDPRLDKNMTISTAAGMTIASCGCVCHVDDLVDDWCPKCCYRGDNGEDIA